MPTVYGLMTQHWLCYAELVQWWGVNFANDIVKDFAILEIKRIWHEGRQCWLYEMYSVEVRET
jgi:hypothetical protein